MHSYHIFYFPFKWEKPETKGKSFSEQTCLEELQFNEYSNWIQNPLPIDKEESDLLYNEKNYYYKFVHPVLYDTGKKDSILKHFERKETQLPDCNITYKIAVKDIKIYSLRVDAINLNLYTTGVGMLTFYLANERDDQKEPEDILAINQFGRRIFPPFMGQLESRSQIAEYLSIEGLYGEASRYYEDFAGYKNEKHPKESYKKAWNPSRMIYNLIKDLIPNAKVRPVIDDRMFVNCWYGNDILSVELKEDKTFDDFLMESNNNYWYQYLFVDWDGETCKNKAMKKKLLEAQTYTRWQREGSLFGFSRYSLVLLTDTGWFANNILAVHMRTVYSRMIELILIQRASTLKFSDEVIRVSRLPRDSQKNEEMIIQISALYKEYIRFVNQIYFREVSAQEQGIELYNLMQKTIDIENHIRSLDAEIEELHQYVSLLDDRTRNRNAEKLNKIAAIFLPATLFAGIFGMNSIDKDGICWHSFITQILFVISGSVIAWLLLLKPKK